MVWTYAFTKVGNCRNTYPRTKKTVGFVVALPALLSTIVLFLLAFVDVVVKKGEIGNGISPFYFVYATPTGCS